MFLWSRDIAVGIATGCWLGGRLGRSSSPGRGNFSPLEAAKTGSGATQPPIQWVMEALLLGIKRLRRETEHLSSTSVEVKNMWIYIPTPPYVFIALCLIS
jgi:hypothetical protein